MRQYKLYDYIKQALIDYPDLRDSDKKLQWFVWMKQGYLSNNGFTQYLTKESFLRAPSTETIRRTRQKIQELHRELRSSQTVMEAKIDKQHEKGTFIYREPIQLAI